MEHWREIQEFPNYSVSNLGRVMNRDTKHVLTLLVNQYHVAYVGLMHDNVQHKRSLAKLVATAFVSRPSIHFDTPINLNGDRTDNSADNLLWRPRWFAVSYNRQFSNSAEGLHRPIQDVETEVVYFSTWEIAITHGLLEIEVRHAIKEGTEVWPTRQRFILL